MHDSRVVEPQDCPEAGADAARRMGLFVVGRLAERHGITVRLMNGYRHEQSVGNDEQAASTGLTARVTVPQDHITTAGSAPPPGTSPLRRLGGDRESTAQG